MLNGHIRILVSRAIIMAALFAATVTSQPPPTVSYTDLHDFNAATGEPNAFSESNLAQGILNRHPARSAERSFQAR